MWNCAASACCLAIWLTVRVGSGRGGRAGGCLCRTPRGHADRPRHEGPLPARRAGRRARGLPPGVCRDHGLQMGCQALPRRGAGAATAAGELQTSASSLRPQHQSRAWSLRLQHRASASSLTLQRQARARTQQLQQQARVGWLRLQQQGSSRAHAAQMGCPGHPRRGACARAVSPVAAGARARSLRPEHPAVC